MSAKYTMELLDEVPAKCGDRKEGGLYLAIMREFVATGNPAALVDMARNGAPRVKGWQAGIGAMLKRIAAREGLPVASGQRGDKLLLRRTDLEHEE